MTEPSPAQASRSDVPTQPSRSGIPLRRPSRCRDARRQSPHVVHLRLSFADAATRARRRRKPGACAVRRGLVARERSSRAADHCGAEAQRSSPPRPYDDCWVQHSVTEKFVLLPVAPRRVRRPSDNLSVDDDLLRQELFSRQIKLGAVGKPIPVVVSALGPVDVYLPEYQVATEQVLNHQCRHPTLVTGRVLGPPILAGVRVTGVRPPRGAEPRPQLLRSQHPMRLTQASDMR